MPVLGTPNFNLQPNTRPTATPGNYLTSSDFTWLQQYLPDTYEAEFERYGNRSVSAFLRLVGAELPSNSDMITWAEQGRLHIKYTNANIAGYANGSATLTIADNIPNPTTGAASGGSMSIRVGNTLFIQTSTGIAGRAIVTAVTAANPTVACTIAFYDNAIATNYTGTTVFVYGSEFRKGTGAAIGSNSMGSLDATDSTQFFQNNPIILKDKFIVSGSDMAQIGWVQIDTEDGATGYLWYLKSASETRLRFDDYLETAMLEAVPALGTGTLTAGAAANGLRGTKGVFYEVNDRGNVWGGSLPATLSDWDSVVGRLDKQGAIEENALFVNRDMSFAIDNFLAGLNGLVSSPSATTISSTSTVAGPPQVATYSYSGNTTLSQGASFGLFDNNVTMALNLGFTGFRRGYDFYKTDWKYLNDPTMRGGLATVSPTNGNVSGIYGLLVPAGTTNVYDQVMGRNAKRPFLHVRYRASETEDRRYKTWVTGSAGTAATNDIDNMEINFLSERCVCVLGANNFVLFRYGA